MRTILYLLLFVSASCVQAQETVERYAFKAMLNGKIPVGDMCGILPPVSSIVCRNSRICRRLISTARQKQLPVVSVPLQVYALIPTNGKTEN